jgi:hypothetical protein
MIVPGGGISADASRWISSPENYLLPVPVLSHLFRGKMLAMLKAAHEAGLLQFFGPHAALTDKAAFKSWLEPLYDTKWHVHAKRPFAGSEAVLGYLARYTHRVALSNSRLIAADESGVTFKYKDYRIEGPARYKTIRCSRASSSAGSCCTYCPRASTASVTTAYSPAARPRPRPSSGPAS